MYTHIHAYEHTHTNKNTHTNPHVCTHTHTHEHIHVHSHPYTCTGRSIATEHVECISAYRTDCPLRAHCVTHTAASRASTHTINVARRGCGYRVRATTKSPGSSSGVNVKECVCALKRECECVHMNVYVCLYRGNRVCGTEFVQLHTRLDVCQILSVCKSMGV